MPRPPYVERQADADLQAAIRDRDDRFVLLVGDSGTGKSRAAYEALVRVFPGHALIVPPRPTTERGALRRIMDPGFRIEATKPPAILWLDDVDAFLDSGDLDLTTLTGLRDRQSPELTLVATIQSAPYEDRMTQPQDADGSTLRNSFGEAAKVLRRAKVVRFKTRWTPEEVDAARRVYPDVPFDPELGLGAQLVDGPLLADRLASAPDDDPGLAVALAAIDARRAGLARQLTKGELGVLWGAYRPARRDAPRPDPLFEAGLTWACARMGSGASLVSRKAEGYMAADYAVALRSGERPGGPVETSIRAPVWAALVRIANPAEAYGLASAAYAGGLFSIAETALEKATTDPERLKAALSWFMLGTIRLIELSHPADAVTALEEVVKLGDEADPESRADPDIVRLVAMALLNKGGALGRLGDPAASISAYDEVVRRFGDEPGRLDPELRQQVAMALLNKGGALSENDPESAIAVYDDVVERFAGDAKPGIREVAAQALENKAVILAQGGNLSPAVAVYDEIVTRFAQDPEPSIRQRVANALFNKGASLGGTDRVAEVAMYDEIVTRYGAESDPAIREEVAKALFNKGVSIEETDPSAAIAVYDGIVTRYGAESEPAIRVEIAKALLRKGMALADGDPRAAITEFDEIVRRFGEAPEANLRERAATALFFKGLMLEDDDPEASIAVYDDVVTRFGADVALAREPAFREVVAKALFNQGVLIGDSNVSATITAYDELVRRFGRDSEPAIRELAARALFNKAVLIGVSDPLAANATYAAIVNGFGADTEPTPELSALITKARRLMDESP